LIENDLEYWKAREWPIPTEEGYSLANKILAQSPFDFIGSKIAK